MPPIGDIRVSPFAIRILKRSPNIFVSPTLFSNVQLLRWVLVPAPPDVLEVKMWKRLYRNYIIEHFIVCLKIFLKCFSLLRMFDYIYLFKKMVER